jgi:hypothetical protein
MILSLIAPLANTALVAPSVGAPDCNIWISQSGITAGSAAQLTWWTMNAGNAMLSDGTDAPVGVAPSGSETITPSSSRTYTLVVTGAAGGSKTCSVSISVTPSTSAAPTCSLSATPGAHYAGQAVRLVWYSQNATGGALSGVGTLSASELAQGSRDVYPTQSTLYTMTVGNNSGSRTCSALVTIGSGNTGGSYNTGYTTYTSGTAYRPVTTQTTYTISSPSYGNSYVTARPLVTSGWYPNPVVNTRSYSSPSYYTSGDEWYTSSPSYTNGLGDYSLTNIWNDAGSGEYLATDHSCSGYWCDSEPDSWAYGAPQNSNLPFSNEYGWYGDNGIEKVYTDTSGRVQAWAAEEDPSIPLDSYYSGDSQYGSWYDSASASGSGFDPYYTSVPGITADTDGMDAWSYYQSPATSPTEYYQTAETGGSWDNPVMMYSPGSQGDTSYGTTIDYGRANTPAWYDWEPNGWNGGTDPNASGVWDGGNWGTSEYSI